MRGFFSGVLYLVVFVVSIYFFVVLYRLIKSCVNDKPKTPYDKLHVKYQHQQMRHKLFILLGIWFSSALIGGLISPSDSTDSKSEHSRIAQTKKKSNKSKKASSSSSSTSLTSSDMQEASEGRGKNIADNLNSQIAQHPELNGFSVNYNKEDDMYEVTVPTEITGDTDNQQKALYNTITGDITQSDPNAMIQFYNSQHMMIAHTTLGGTVKLDE